MDPLSRLGELLYVVVVEEFDEGARVLALKRFEVAL
jgi:hypothetical protein